MVKEMFKLSSRVDLILGNLKTVVEVIDVLETEYKDDVDRFLQYIKNNLKDNIPELSTWEITLDDYAIYFYPEEWKILDEDFIYITVNFDINKNLLKSSPLYNDPFVGLYAPEEWSIKYRFKDLLNKALPKNFKDEWDEPEDVAPIFVNIEYENYAKGDYFDIDGFWEKIVELVSEIVKIKPEIDNILNEIRDES